MASSAVTSVYKWVMDDVVQKMSQRFAELGMDVNVLAELQQTWEAKIIAMDVAAFAQPSQMPLASIPVPQLPRTLNAYPPENAYSDSLQIGQYSYIIKEETAPYDYSQNLTPPVGSFQLPQNDGPADDDDDEDNAIRMSHGASQRIGNNRRSSVGHMQLYTHADMSCLPQPVSSSLPLERDVTGELLRATHASMRARQHCESLNRVQSVDAGEFISSPAPAPAPVSTALVMESTGFVSMSTPHGLSRHDIDRILARQILARASAGQDDDVATDAGVVSRRRVRACVEGSESRDAPGKIPQVDGAANDDDDEEDGDDGDEPAAFSGGRSGGQMAAAGSGSSSTGRAATNLVGPGGTAIIGDATGNDISGDGDGGNGVGASGTGNGGAGESDINSDLDDDDDDDEHTETPNLVLCLYEKVQRVKNKWKCVLKDGVGNINGKDYLFNKANCDFQW